MADERLGCAGQRGECAVPGRFQPAPDARVLGDNPAVARGPTTGVRGIAGHLQITIAAIAQLVDTGITVQVNTTVMGGNLDDLPGVAALVARSGAHIWEVFFLVQVGRGTAVRPLSPAGHEDVCHFLYDASAYGFIVRTVEAPFFRRVVRARRAGAPAPDSALYRNLSGHLTDLLGPATGRPSAHTAPTRDGKGIVFVSHDGDVYPAGFLPLSLGSIRARPLREIYRDDPLLKSIRAAMFTGRYGTGWMEAVISLCPGRLPRDTMTAVARQ